MHAVCELSLTIMNRRLAMKKLNENTWCIGLAPLEGLVRSSRRAVMWVSLSLFFKFSREGSWIFSINSSSKSSAGNIHTAVLQLLHFWGSNLTNSISVLWFVYCSLLISKIKKLLLSLRNFRFYLLQLAISSG